HVLFADAVEVALHRVPIQWLRVVLHEAYIDAVRADTVLRDAVAHARQLDVRWELHHGHLRQLRALVRMRFSNSASAFLARARMICRYAARKPSRALTGATGLKPSSHRGASTPGG